MGTIKPEAAPDTHVDQEQLSKDAGAFGIEVANSVQAELEREAREERLQAIQTVFMQAVSHIEMLYGLTAGTMWMEHANQAMRQRFAELNEELAPTPT